MQKDTQNKNFTTNGNILYTNLILISNKVQTISTRGAYNITLFNSHIPTKSQNLGS